MQCIYFYHPDHLGTATLLTDANGIPYEFFLNLPFGETMIEQHSLTEDYENRWKFTGHELDKETGMYYAGARYYDPRTSIFISVDPLAELMPSFGGYIYTFNNPIRYTDPTGMLPCEECPSNAQEGDTYTSKGGGDYSYGDGKWTRNDGALDEIVVTASKSGANLSNSGYSKDDLRVRRQLLSGGANDPISRNLLLNEQRGIFRPLHDPSKPYEGFAEEYAAGWNNWDKDGIGNAWMNIAAGGIGITLMLPVASVAGPGLGMQGLRSTAVKGFTLLEKGTTTLEYIGMQAYFYTNYSACIITSSTASLSYRAIFRTNPLTAPNFNYMYNIDYVGNTWLFYQYYSFLIDEYLFAKN